MTTAGEEHQPLQPMAAGLAADHHQPITASLTGGHSVEEATSATGPEADSDALPHQLSLKAFDQLSDRVKEILNRIYPSPVNTSDQCSSPDNNNSGQTDDVLLLKGMAASSPPRTPPLPPTSSPPSFAPIRGDAESLVSGGSKGGLIGDGTWQPPSLGPSTQTLETAVHSNTGQRGGRGDDGVTAVTSNSRVDHLPATLDIASPETRPASLQALASPVALPPQPETIPSTVLPPQSFADPRSPDAWAHLTDRRGLLGAGDASLVGRTGGAGGGEEGRSVREILERRGHGGATETELWALCQQCVLAVQRRIHDLPPYISIETVQISNPGVVSFRNLSLQSELNSLYLAPEVQHKGILTDKSCLFGIAVMLQSVANEKSAANQKPELSQELRELLGSMSVEQPNQRPNMTQIINMCDKHLSLKRVSSLRVCSEMAKSSSKAMTSPPVLSHITDRTQTPPFITRRLESAATSAGTSQLALATPTTTASHSGFTPLNSSSQPHPSSSLSPDQTLVGQSSPVALLPGRIKAVGGLYHSTPNLLRSEPAAPVSAFSKSPSPSTLEPRTSPLAAPSAFKGPAHSPTQLSTKDSISSIRDLKASTLIDNQQPAGSASSGLPGAFSSKATHFKPIILQNSSPSKSAAAQSSAKSAATKSPSSQDILKKKMKMALKMELQKPRLPQNLAHDLENETDLEEASKKREEMQRAKRSSGGGSRRRSDAESEGGKRRSDGEGSKRRSDGEGGTGAAAGSGGAYSEKAARKLVKNVLRAARTSPSSTSASSSQQAGKKQQGSPAKAAAATASSQGRVPPPQQLQNRQPSPQQQQQQPPQPPPGQFMMPNFSVPIQLQQDPKTGMLQLVPMPIQMPGATATLGQQPINFGPVPGQPQAVSFPASGLLPQQQQPQQQQPQQQQQQQLNGDGNDPNEPSHQDPKRDKERPHRDRSKRTVASKSRLYNRRATAASQSDSDSTASEPSMTLWRDKRSHYSATAAGGSTRSSRKPPLSVFHPPSSNPGDLSQLARPLPSRPRPSSGSKLLSASSPTSNSLSSRDSGVVVRASSSVEDVYQGGTTGPTPDKLSSNSTLKKIVHHIRETFAYDGYLENGIEDLAMAEYVSSLSQLKWETFHRAITEKFCDLYWDQELLEKLFETVNGYSAPPRAERPAIPQKSHHELSMSSSLEGTSEDLTSDLLDDSLPGLTRDSSRDRDRSYLFPEDKAESSGIKSLTSLIKNLSVDKSQSPHDQSVSPHDRPPSPHDQLQSPGGDQLAGSGSLSGRLSDSSKASSSPHIRRSLVRERSGSGSSPMVRKTADDGSGSRHRSRKLELARRRREDSSSNNSSPVPHVIQVKSRVSSQSGGSSTGSGEDGGTTRKKAWNSDRDGWRDPKISGGSPASPLVRGDPSQEGGRDRGASQKTAPVAWSSPSSSSLLARQDSMVSAAGSTSSGTSRPSLSLTADDSSLTLSDAPSGKSHHRPKVDTYLNAEEQGSRIEYDEHLWGPNDKQQNIEAKITEIEQQLMMENKMKLKSEKFYQKLLDSQAKGADQKTMLSKVGKQIGEMEGRIATQQLVKNHLEMLYAEHWGLDHHLLHSFTYSNQSEPMELEATDDNLHLLFTSDLASLQAGTPQGLFSYLFARRALLQAYLHHFFYTYHYYATHWDVFNFLVEKFVCASSVSVEQQEYGIKVHNRAVDIIQVWVEGFYDVDFRHNSELVAQLINFINEKVLPVDEQNSFLLRLISKYQSQTLEDDDVMKQQERRLFQQVREESPSEMVDKTHKANSFRLPLSLSKKTGGRDKNSQKEKTKVGVISCLTPNSKGQDQATPSGVYLPTFSMHKDGFSLSEHTSIVLVHQLTLIQQALFRKTHPVHYLDSRAFGVGVHNTNPLFKGSQLTATASAEGQAKETAVAETLRGGRDSIRQLLEHETNVTHWVSAEILCCSSSKAQVAMLTKLIHMAKACYDIRNFATAIQIVDGLENLMVKQLPAWRSLPSKVVGLLEELRTAKVLLQSDNQCMVSGESGVKGRGQALPAIHFFLMHVQQEEMGNFQLANGMYKWTKMRSIAKLIDQIRVFKNHYYTFEPDHELQGLLRERVLEFKGQDLQMLAAQQATNFHQHLGGGSRKLHSALLKKVKASLR